jgi:dTDP-4-dehydrorhamnose reductase
VAESGHYGTFNMVGRGGASRYDVALELVSLLGLADRVEVVPVTSDFFADTYFAERPVSEQLTNDRLQRLGLDLMRPWREALADYVGTFAADVGPRRRAQRSLSNEP